MWISTKNKLPDMDDFVLAGDDRANEFAFVRLQKNESGNLRWFRNNPDDDMEMSHDFDDFTHWMPVPDLPETEEG